MKAAATLALAILLTGCLSARNDPGVPFDDMSDGEAWAFGGAWTTDHTQADLDAWCAIAREYGNECAVMESWPPQYMLRLTSEAQCQEARTRVLALDHISARECSRIEPADDPDAPVSSPPMPRYVLHGTFAPGYTAADVDAVCRAGTGSAPCAMMKSEPPQYAFDFASRDACEDARAQMLAVATARPGACREA